MERKSKLISVKMTSIQSSMVESLRKQIGASNKGEVIRGLIEVAYSQANKGRATSRARDINLKKENPGGWMPDGSFHFVGVKHR